MSDEATMSQNNLLADVLKWKQRARDYKAQAEAATKERDALKEQVASLESDLTTLADGLDEMESKLNASPDEYAKRVEELEKEIWTRDTRAKFEKLADQNRVRPEARDDLWKLLEFSADKDADLDEAGFTERVTSAVKARESYLVQSDPATGNGAAVPQQGLARPEAKPPGLGLARGAPEPPTPSDPATAARNRLASKNAITSNGNLRLA